MEEETDQVYGIMREPYMKSGTLGLLFFSKVSLPGSRRPN
jgi:hypothetical protein